MRRPLLALAALSLPLAACGPKELALSDDPVTRAAQCAAVAASAARAVQKDVKATLPFSTQATILQHALIVGTAGGGYDQDRAGAVLKAMPAAGEEVSAAQWKPLQPACDQAFPEAKAPVALPASTLDAELGCSQLADYIQGAMQSQEALYSDELSPLRAMRLKLDNRIGGKLTRSGKTGVDAQEGPRDRAMNAIVHAGAAPEVLDACVARFGEKV